MKRGFFAGLVAVVVLALSGCGDNGGSPAYVTQILSDASFDGDIAKDAVTGVHTITQGNTQSVYAGFDPADGSELRAFLHFPLTGASGVPGNAVILHATLDIFINSIQPNPLTGTIPIRIDLVDFQPPNLIATDFDRTLQPALATTTIFPEISTADFGRHVPVDVTGLMVEAQRLGLADFQVRILRDGGVVDHGLIEINDTTGPNRDNLAPLLEVAYF